MAQEIHAVVENFDGIELVGWARFAPETRAALHVEVPGLGRHKIERFQPRSDLVATKGCVAGEYHVVLDELFPEILEYSLGDRVEPFRVRLSAGPPDEGRPLYEFEGSWGLVEAAIAARPKSDGRIDTFDDKWISGWALSADQDCLEIEVLADDKVVATGATGLYRGDVARLRPSGAYSGFVMPTPSIICDGFPHTVLIRCSKQAWIFPGFPRQVRLGRVVGTVEKIQQNAIEGWFGFLRRPDLAAKILTIRCNGEPIGSTILRAARPDVVAAGLAAEAFAFRFETRRGLFAEDVITVSDDSSDYVLKTWEKAKPQDLPSAIVGHLDLASDAEIVGWALDRRRPAEAVRVIALSDGVPVAEASTEGFRADVQRSFPQALRPGFVIRTPRSLRDGQPHRVELRVAGSHRTLGGTPCDIRLSKMPAVYRHEPTAALTALEDRARLFVEARSGKQANPRIGGVSHIILNKNGGDVFVRCLESLLKFLDPWRDELIVVDHASTDVSRDALSLLEQSASARVVWKPRNDSFSKSNNDAAAIATRPVLLFLNNDIEFIADISRGVERHLRSPDIGAVGIKLYDIVEPSSDEASGRDLRTLRLQHLGVWFHPGQARDGYNLVGYDITSAAAHREMFGLHEVAVVTGAALGMRAEDFDSIGGFDEKYYYGTEDVDLCLRVRHAGKRVVCDRSLEALHVRGYTRFTRRGGDASTRFAANNKHLWGKLGGSLRRDHLRSVVSRDGVYGPPVFRVGLAVTEAGERAVAGDFFTALELGRSLAAHKGVEYVFLSEKEDWYDCNGLDAVVVMRHDYDLRRVKNQRSGCLFIAWARNHFETWLRQPWLDQFDIFLSSSTLFSGLLLRSHGIRAHSVYIATSFREPPNRNAIIDHDVVFVGSRWGGARELEAALIPERINGTVGIYGAGFGDVPALRPVWRGVVPYADVEGIYHRSQIVVDDANPTTKRWGSPNSRVFDAIAAGAIVLTNSRATSSVLGGTVPVWTDADDLTGKINNLLAADADALAARQASVVKRTHTYAARAQAILDILRDHAESGLRVDILTAVPAHADAELWGDWHFAQALARAFRRKGHAVRVRKLGETLDRATDVVLGLRGLQRFEPVIGAVNILWIISHPDLVAPEELKQWQHVFVASRRLAKRFAPHALSLSVLEQATEFTPSSLWAARRELKGSRRASGVFVGNTRGVTREFVASAAKASLEFEVWGQGWEGTALHDRVAGKSIGNNRLGCLYASAPFVLSDHWSDMAREGIVSNRVFDAIAAGGVVITDQVAGIEALDLPNLFVCRNESEIREAAGAAAALSDEARLKGARSVASKFSFRARADSIEAIAFELLASQGQATATSHSQRKSTVAAARMPSRTKFDFSIHQENAIEARE